MVLQLVTAGGTFPWQTLPAPLEALHGVLPMGFVVDALRQVMYGGDIARVWTDMGVVLAVGSCRGDRHDRGGGAHDTLPDTARSAAEHRPVTPRSAGSPA